MPLSSLNPFRRVDNDQYSDSMPHYPAATLIVHVALKGAQMGSLLGLAVFLPLLHLKRRKTSSLVSTWARVMNTSGILGTTVATGLLIGKAASSDTMNDAGVDDRAYRISKNAGQNEVDKYSLVGLVAGGGVGVFAGRVVACSGTGIALGTSAYMVKRILQSKT